MTVTNGKKLEIEKRRADVAKLYLRGYSVRQIAPHVGVSHKTVHEDLVAIRAEWMASRVGAIDEQRRIEAEKIDALEREAWEAFDRSQKDAETVKTVDTEDGYRTERTVQRQVGDPRFLTVLRSCYERRAKLMGLDSPDKMQNFNINAGADLSVLRQELLGEGGYSDYCRSHQENIDAGAVCEDGQPESLADGEASNTD